MLRGHVNEIGRLMSSAMFARIVFTLPLLTVVTAAPTTLAEPPARSTEQAEQTWRARLKCPGGWIRFGLRTRKNASGKWGAELINGDETIKVRSVDWVGRRLTLHFPHYDSRLEASRDVRTGQLRGTWVKVAGKDKHSRLPFVAEPVGRSTTSAAPNPDAGDTFTGRWAVDFSSSDDPAVAVIRPRDADSPDPRSLRATFLTTTGDYRYLAGEVVDGELRLSVFDGAHAFLFRARSDSENRLSGEFWSRDSWHETWTAKRDSQAKLPDAFAQTRYVDETRLDDLKFPTLDGELTSLADPRFAGKMKIITIFGSWCPNCHDSALYLAELHRRYASRGLSIVGLAFELTGDFERDAKQVRRYVQRHETPYPVLLAGLADKKQASKRLPILDRVRSYPTTIFLNDKDEVITIHTGFSGPATGDAYKRLRVRFEAIIEQQLRL